MNYVPTMADTVLVAVINTDTSYDHISPGKVPKHELVLASNRGIQLYHLYRATYRLMYEEIYKCNWKQIKNRKTIKIPQ